MRMSEIKEAIYKPKLNKSDDIIGLQSNHFVNAGDDLHVHLAMLLTGCFMHCRYPVFVRSMICRKRTCFCETASGTGRVRIKSMNKDVFKFKFTFFSSAPLTPYVAQQIQFYVVYARSNSSAFEFRLKAWWFAMSCIWVGKEFHTAGSANENWAPFTELQTSRWLLIIKNMQHLHLASTGLTRKEMQCQLSARQVLEDILSFFSSVKGRS